MKARKVLFVCLGNSCRSQMAEGFAKAYGSDVTVPKSAGLSPASTISELTKTVMLEKNIKLEGHFPKSLGDTALKEFDLVVNMSGYPMPVKTLAEVREWSVRDPIGQPGELYREVRDQIENLVMQLILELRRKAKPARSLTRPARH